MQAPELLSARGMQKQYPGPDGEPVTVLQSLDLSVKPGEFIVILGRSGSGKTTLLNLLGLLDRPSAGELSLAGKRTDQHPDSVLSDLRRELIGFVFQDYSLLPTLTVAQNLALPLALNKVPKTEHKARIDAALGELGLDGLAARFPDQLSGGQQQRVAVARALIHDPKLVLADEPTGNLDIDTAMSVVERLDDATRRRGGALVMVTHSQEVMGAADRCLRLDHGQLKPAAVATSP